MGGQFAIMRFAKYKGGAMGGIEAHNERTKEKYKSNPDVDTTRSDQNFHLITPTQSYRAESDRQISEAKCRVRSDSVKMVEALFTASPEFFEGKSKKEVRAFFQEALTFFTQHQRPDTIISAVVHMDEKTPHMHLTFVPLTKDNRLCAKEIIGNKKKLTEWQDKYWKHMVSKYPDLERGESASTTGRTHIPPRLYKEMEHLEAQEKELDQLLGEVNMLNSKKKAEEIQQKLHEMIPRAEKLKTELRKYKNGNQTLTQENKALANENNSVRRAHMHAEMESAKAKSKLIGLEKTMEKLPAGLVEAYCKLQDQGKEKENER